MNDPTPYTDLFARVAAGNALTGVEAETALDAVMRGDVPDEALSQFLLDLRARGETADEIAGAARALRRHMRPIRVAQETFLDTCGTGGDGARTFNISTAAAIVTAAAGVTVAKHGSRSVSSRSGSSDVLTALGVDVLAELPVVERCIAELGIGFCFAPLYHPAMKRVSEVRRALGVPTIFNLLGPLANPAGAPCQVLGVGKPDKRPLLAEALRTLGTRRAVVVCGEDGLDEVTLAAPTRVSLVEGDAIEELVWTPEDFGVTRSSLDPLTIDGPEESAAMIMRIFAGEAGPTRDIVVINAAAALWVAGRAATLRECAALVRAVIDRGAAREKLAALAESSRGS